MQADNITLSSGVEPSVDETLYTRFESTPTRTTYIAENHLPASRKLVSLFRNTPKRAGNFQGVGKSSIKMTNDISVAGVDPTTALIVPLIIEINFSVPVGADSITVQSARERAISLLANASVMDKLNLQLMI